SGTGSISFHGLQVASGITTFNGNVAVSDTLQTSSGATADFSTNEVTVETAVTNGGSIKQTRTAANGITTVFAHIQNAAGTTDQYFGVEITLSTGSMGATTVAIRGGGGIDGVQRSYEITPGTDRTALTRFYYRLEDQNGQIDPKVFHWNGSSWDNLGASAIGGSGDGMYVEATTSDYSPFVLSDNTPTRASIGKVVLSYVSVADALGILVQESNA
ncbi:MAG: hypothetical protein GY703_04795, partial [Gammaproteobacteria bacterium]|nr:hypothetical protein [Gammaproteobacteria bacterium]